MAYDEAAREIYGEQAFLNFPNAGEKKTTQTQKPIGLCPKSHDLSVTGYQRKDGGVNCRECNKMAARRAYAKKRARVVGGKPSND